MLPECWKAWSVIGTELSLREIFGLVVPVHNQRLELRFICVSMVGAE